jgi:RNA polymerase sigma-70 factor (ECF subfamily)
VPLARQRVLVDAFIAASQAGDFEALLRILDPDVVIRADTAADRGPFAGVTEVRGARAVAAQAAAFGRFAAGARRATVNGGAGAVVYSGGRPFAVVGVTIRGDTIVEMDFILRPERLRALGLGVA